MESEVQVLRPWHDGEDLGNAKNIWKANVRQYHLMLKSGLRHHRSCLRLRLGRILGLQALRFFQTCPAKLAPPWSGHDKRFLRFRPHGPWMQKSWRLSSCKLVSSLLLLTFLSPWWRIASSRSSAPCCVGLLAFVRVVAHAGPDRAVRLWTLWPGFPIAGFSSRNRGARTVLLHNSLNPLKTPQRAECGQSKNAGRKLSALSWSSAPVFLEWRCPWRWELVWGKLQPFFEGERLDVYSSARVQQRLYFLPWQCRAVPCLYSYASGSRPERKPALTSTSTERGGYLVVDLQVLAGDTRGFRDPPTGREHPSQGHKAWATSFGRAVEWRWCTFQIFLNGKMVIIKKTRFFWL